MRNLFKALFATLTIFLLSEISYAQRSVKDIEGTFLTIQVGAYMSPPPNSFFKAEKELIIAESPEGIKRFNLGTFDNIDEAKGYLNALHKRFKDAFITAYVDGQRVAVKDALGLDKDLASVEDLNNEEEEPVSEQNSEITNMNLVQEEDKAQKEEEARKQAELEAARIKAEEEAAQKKAEEEAARIKAEEEAAQKKTEEEAARIKAEEEAAQKKAEEEAARIKAEEEAAQKKAEEEAARIKAEEEAAAKEKARLDSLKQAEEVPEGMEVVHHSTKVDSAGTKDSTIVEEETQTTGVDSLLALAYKDSSATEEKSESEADNEPVASSMLNIEDRKVLFNDTIWNEGDASEFTYNFTKPVTLYLDVVETKNKSLKGFQLDQMKWKTDGTVDVNTIFKQDDKFKTLTDAQVDVPTPGVYRLRFDQPSGSLRKISMNIEAKMGEGDKYPTIASASRMFKYSNYEAGKSLIGSPVEAYKKREVFMELLYKGDVFIAEKEVIDFDQNYYRGNILNLSCCESGKDYKLKYAIERPVKQMVFFQEGDTVLFMLNEVRNDKGDLMKLKDLGIRRYGCDNPVFQKHDVLNSKFAFVVAKDGYYEILYDTYTPSPYLLSGGLSVLTKDGAKRAITTADLELVFFYKYNSYTQKEDLKFGLAPSEHVKENMKK